MSWHARGAAAFSFHHQLGDVCEMSPDVVALGLAFDGGADPEAVAAAPPAGLEPTPAAQFVAILVERGILVEVGDPDPLRLSRRRPYVPRLAVFELDGDDVIAYGRDTVIRLPKLARALQAADGVKPLGQLLPKARWPQLLRLAAPDLAALKLLPPGSGRPPWAESTMPWPAVDPRRIIDGSAGGAPDDLAAYHQAIVDPTAQFEEIETTLSHLFRAPHPALGGATFGARLAEALVAHGAPPRGARVVEVGGGLGYLGGALRAALAPRSYLVVDRSPALAAAQRRRGLASVVGDARALPIADRSVDLLVSNEMAGDLGTADGVNLGALALVDECARILAPGGVAYVSEFGHPTAPPRRSDHLDHDESSIRFADLAERAASRGLVASIEAVPALVRLDGSRPALVTTRASFAALRSLIRSHGGELEKRAWLADEITALLQRLGLDPRRLHGLVFAPIGERTMGLCPGEFFALVARRSEAG